MQHYIRRSCVAYLTRSQRQIPTTCDTHISSVTVWPSAGALRHVCHLRVHARVHGGDHQRMLHVQRVLLQSECRGSVRGYLLLHRLPSVLSVPSLGGVHVRDAQGSRRTYFQRPRSCHYMYSACKEFSQ